VPLKKLSIKGILSIILIMLFSGCLNKDVVPIDASASQNLSNKTFTFVKREWPTAPFIYTTIESGEMAKINSDAAYKGTANSSDVTRALINEDPYATGGAIAGVIIGNMVDEINPNKHQSNRDKNFFIETPEHHLNVNLSNNLEKKYHIKYVSKEIVTDKISLEDLVKEYNDVDYIIDNKNVQWMAFYHTFHLNSYYVKYMSEMRFIDVKNKKVIARSFCDYEQEYSENSPTYRELFAEDGKLLKKITKEAIDNCAKKYLQEVF
jgi:hypothetical protein